MNNKIKWLRPSDILYILIGMIVIPIVATFYEIRGGDAITLNVILAVVVYIAGVLISSRITAIEKELEDLKKLKQK